MEINEDSTIVENMLRWFFSYEVPYGNKYGLSTGNKGGFCTREMYEFENVTEIENLMLGLADMLNKIRCNNGGNLR